MCAIFVVGELKDNWSAMLARDCWEPEGLLLVDFSAGLLSAVGNVTEVRSDVHTLLREEHAWQIIYPNHSGQYPVLNSV